jgi:hypothetical protein
MLTEYNFVLGQVRYVRAAINAISTYRPDEATVQVVDSIIGGAKQVRLEYLDKHADMGLARGVTGSAVEKLHDACVSVYPSMKSAYRKDAENMTRIDTLPVDDRSIDETFRRGQAIERVWLKLPNPPGWQGPFKVGSTTVAVFSGLVSALETAQENEANKDEAWQVAEGRLHTQQRTMSDFVTAALTQGRGQFPEGTPEREAIDRVPTEPSTQAPGKAVISVAESPAPGQVHLVGDAPHATTLQVWRKGPGETQYTMVDEIIRPGEYVAAGLTEGEYHFQLVGENSRGTGEASNDVVIVVAAQAAA